jgi:predicted metal-binding membrane protein
MGMKNGAWCVGCCWALMASLFGLGVMSIVWMAVVAALIAYEKTVPWGRPATYGTAIVLLALGVCSWRPPPRYPACPSRTAAECHRCREWARSPSAG